MELIRITALDEERVRIMALGQEHAARGDAFCSEMLCELLGGLLAAAVGIDIEGEINGAWTIAQLSKLVSAEMRAERAGEVAKPRLPQHGIIEQTLDENHFGTLLNLFPGIQTTLGAGKESMSDGRSDAAAVEVDDVSTPMAREDDALVESVAAPCIQ